MAVLKLQFTSRSTSLRRAGEQEWWGSMGSARQTQGGQEDISDAGYYHNFAASGSLMKENLTIVHFLTCGVDPHSIFFVHAKAVLGKMGSGKKHWYDKRGHNGVANWVWQEKQTKQWTFAATDEVVEKWISTLVQDRQIVEAFGEKEIVFRAAYQAFEFVPEKFEWRNLPPLLHQRERKWIATDTFFPISILADEPANIDFLEGYRKDNKIKPLQPTRLFTEGFLKECIPQKVFIHHEPRAIDFLLSGDRNNLNTKGDTMGLMGHCFEPDDFRSKHTVVCMNLQEQQIGESPIDQSGSWYIKTTESANRGIIALANTGTGALSYASYFYLIKSFKIDAKIIGTTLKGKYGKQYNLVPDEEKAYPMMEAYSWEESYFTSRVESRSMLHEKMVAMLASLGKDIVLNDPYMFGHPGEIGMLQINESQDLFFDALTHAMAIVKLESISIVGRWQDVRKSFSNEAGVGSKELLHHLYHQLFMRIKETLGDGNFHLKRIDIFYPAEKFHDRFWAALDTTRSVKNIYHISSSVSAYVENGELMVIPLTGSILNKTKKKIEDRLHTPDAFGIEF